MSRLNEQEREVFDLLRDKESQKLFLALKRLNETNDRIFFLDEFDFSKEALTLIDRLRSEKYYIYGGGTIAKQLLLVLEHFGVDKNCVGAWDKNPQLNGTRLVSEVLPLPLPYYPKQDRTKYSEQNNILISLPERTEYSGELVLVGISPQFGPYDSVIETIRNLDVPDEKIIQPFYLLLAHDGEPFPEDIILNHLGNNEIFVDGGCYDFATCEEFLKHCPEAKKIYAFEPDERQYAVCEENMKKSCFDNILLTKAGLWDSEAEITFTEGGSKNSGGSFVTTDGEIGTTTVRVAAFDDIVEADDRITFVKMDIEGAELKALKGMERTIVRDKPKLAICIYHRPTDYIDILKYLHTIMPEYKMYIRNYRTNLLDTILFCV